MAADSGRPAQLYTWVMEVVYTFESREYSRVYTDIKAYDMTGAVAVVSEKFRRDFRPDVQVKTVRRV